MTDDNWKRKKNTHKTIYDVSMWFYISFQVARINFFIVCNKVSLQKRKQRDQISNEISSETRSGRAEKIALTRQIPFLQILLNTI